MAEPEHNHESHSIWPLIALGSIGALVAAPFVLPALGMGSTEAAAAATDDFHAHSIAEGTGLAGFMAKGISHIPLVGESLAAGGWASIATSSVIGIGGVLLSNWLKNREHAGDFPWSKVIRYGALATSMLISLPSLLTGIGISITFLANFLINDPSTMNSLVTGLTQTLGTASMAHMASGGGVLATLLPHLLGCGFPLITAGFAMSHPVKSHPTTTPTPTACSVRMAAMPATLKGQPCEVAFQLIDSETGRPLEESELKTMHTRKLHTMIVDSSLRDYHHIHPTYDPARKLFTCQFTPALQGGYTMWNDVTLQGADAPNHLRTELSPIQGYSIPPRVQHTSHVEGQGLRVTITPDTPLRAGSAGTLTLDIRDAAGARVSDLEPIMGAYAHLVGFSADGQHFIHTHPMGAEPQSPDARGESPLRFHVLPKVDGPTQFFLQIQRNGQIITLPFGQMIQKENYVDMQTAILRGIPVAIIAGSHRQNAYAMSNQGAATGASR